MRRIASPGKLRHKVIIEKPATCEEPDTTTDQPQCWQTVVKCWAAIRPVSVKEIYAGNGFVGQGDVAVTVRYDPRLDDLDHRWRIWWQNRKLDIVGKTSIDGRDIWLKIMTCRDAGDIRLRTEDFDDPLHNAVHVVIPELANG